MSIRSYTQPTYVSSFDYAKRYTIPTEPDSLVSYNLGRNYYHKNNLEPVHTNSYKNYLLKSQLKTSGLNSKRSHSRKSKRRKKLTHKKNLKAFFKVNNMGINIYNNTEIYNGQDYLSKAKHNHQSKNLHLSYFRT